VRSFAARLAAWQRRHGRHDLPWQGSRDAYRIWLSEVMLQQTQVASVLRYYERFLAAFPDLGSLAAAAEDEVLAQWSGLGYYTRARHLHAAARRVVDERGGVFPSDVATLQTLPGVGASTAAAIAVFAAGERAAILDGNVKRVLARHRGIAGDPSRPATHAALWDAARRALPRTGIEAYTQGLMDLGATVCTRGAPRCDACPVAGDCVARREDRIGELPGRRARRARPTRAVQVLWIERAGEVLLERRPAKGVWARLWSLPEIDVDADPVRGARERGGVPATLVERLAPIDHALTHVDLVLHPVRLAARSSRRPPPAPCVWLARDDLPGAALPAPIRRLLSAERPPPSA
jgi:A/G-specific adenine glycosylase